MRRKLFSDYGRTYKVRRKLFSGSDEGVNLKEVVCRDCGYEMTTAANVSSIFCPKCGGKRFDLLRVFESPENTPEPVRGESKEKNYSGLCDGLFQREFCEPTNSFESALKEYSGKTISMSEFGKVFSDTSIEDLEERGFAEVLDDGNVSILPAAFAQAKLFSKIVVSITKVLDLDPEITCKHNPESIIEDLEYSNRLCPKSILILKKAHGIVPRGGGSNCNCGGSCNCEPGHCMCECKKWADESGILGDLKIEFGGQVKPLSEFNRTINSRYPDAPLGLMDFLKSIGVIRPSNFGSEIEILK